MIPRYRYKEEKALAVASKLLELSGNQCDKYWLNKLMYYIERQCIIKGGKPVFFDRLFSIPYGPIASAVNDSIDLTAYDVKSPWREHFALDGKRVRLKKAADYSVLSPFEISLIEEAHKKFKGWSFNQVHDFFSKLPENKDTNSREEIEIDDILIGEGFDPVSIEEIINEISYFETLEETLHCAR